MILLLAVILGLAAGLLRARYYSRKFDLPKIQHAWLVLVAVLPQLIVFNLPGLRANFPDQGIPWLLMSSQLLLVIFVWVNRTLAGFLLIGCGLILNLIVITLNGGWMPISPLTVERLAPNAAAGSWAIGERLGWTKDMVLLSSETRLAWLSDRFITPGWAPYQAAFSLGDVLLGVGTFWFLWSLGGPAKS